MLNILQRIIRLYRLQECLVFCFYFQISLSKQHLIELMVLIHLLEFLFTLLKGGLAKAFPHKELSLPWILLRSSSQRRIVSEIYGMLSPLHAFLILIVPQVKSNLEFSFCNLVFNMPVYGQSQPLLNSLFIQLLFLYPPQLLFEVIILYHFCIQSLLCNKVYFKQFIILKFYISFLLSPLLLLNLLSPLPLC